MAGHPHPFAQTVLLLPSLPSGSITEWSGAILDIPDGWLLCDGNNGTPDLRDKFIVGAGLTFAVGNEGGSINHTHTLTCDGHLHDLTPGSSVGGGPNWAKYTNKSFPTGTANAADTKPPYFSLAFIKKI